MRVRAAFPFIVAGPCLLAQGCSYLAWYQGLQEQQRQECYKNYSQQDVQICIDKVNSMTYDDYRKRREGITGEKGSAATAR